MQDVLAQKLALLHGEKQTTDGDMQSWRDDVAALYRAAEEWLHDEIEQKILYVVLQVTHVQESNAESYAMNQFAIQLNSGPLLLLVPRGRNVVGAVLKQGSRITGARGRVDLVNFEDRRALGLFRGDGGKWFIPTPNSQEAWALLDKEHFRAAMASLLPTTP